MKKKYLKPSFKTFKVEGSNLLVGSQGSGTGSGTGGGGGSL